MIKQPDHTKENHVKQKTIAKEGIVVLYQPICSLHISNQIITRILIDKY